MKVTLDTNVLISGTFWSGDSFKVLELIDKGELELFLSEDILSEYEEATESDEIIDKIFKKELIISELTERVISKARMVIPARKIKIVKEDFDDDKIIECASEGKVDFIVTNDNHLLKLKEFEGIKILTPKDFLLMSG